MGRRRGLSSLKSRWDLLGVVEGRNGREGADPGKAGCGTSGDGGKDDGESRESSHQRGAQEKWRVKGEWCGGRSAITVR